MRITVIGAGNMGGALIKGWAKAAQQKGNLEITAADRSEATLAAIKEAFPCVNTSTDNREAVKDADVVFVVVKPWLAELVVKDILPALDLTRQSIVSVAANVLTGQVREWLGAPSSNVFYAIPNIAAEYGQSMNFLAAAEGVAKEKTDGIAALFSLVGEVMVVEERLVLPGMLMASCGIAYVMRFLRAMQEGGVEMGFYPQQAKDIALQTMQGAVTLLKETGLHPEAAIDKVTTPGGVTIKGLNKLEEAGFTNAVIQGLLVSAQKK